jgi:hypothetical protein
MAHNLPRLKNNGLYNNTNPSVENAKKVCLKNELLYAFNKPRYGKNIIRTRR